MITFVNKLVSYALWAAVVGPSTVVVLYGVSQGWPFIASAALGVWTAMLVMWILSLPYRVVSWYRWRERCRTDAAVSSNDAAVPADVVTVSEES